MENEDDYGDNGDVKPLQISDIQQEAAIMSSLRHENIVSCFASFVVRDELWLIMPFVSGGSTSYILSHSISNFYSKGIKLPLFLFWQIQFCDNWLIYHWTDIVISYKINI